MKTGWKQKMSLIVTLLTIVGCQPPIINPDKPPRIIITKIPDYGSKQPLQGRVNGVNPNNYVTVVYILNSDKWWTKPYSGNGCWYCTSDPSDPLTEINWFSAWSCDVTTGDNDEYATAFAAYLVPKYDSQHPDQLISVPDCGGCPELPDIPEAVAFIRVERPAPAGQGPKIVTLGNWDFSVKEYSDPVGPGPNIFSQDNVWIDGDGMHLMISHQDNGWQCAEVILTQSLGYGTYVFNVQGRLDQLDPKVIFCHFLWDDNTDDPDHREMDIGEFGVFGNASRQDNCQFVVKPNYCCDHQNISTFPVDQSDGNEDLTTYCIWSAGRVEMRLYRGQYGFNQPPEEALIYSWVYAGDAVPDEGNERVHFNLWLWQGQAPNNGEEKEVLVKGFDFSEQTPDWIK